MMEKKDRDNLDELFRARLYDWEADTSPADWEAIAEKLPPAGRVVFFRQTFRYWAAAAAVLLAVVSAGLYLFDEKELTQTPLADQAEQQPEKVVAEEEVATPVMASVEEKKNEPAKQMMSIPRKVQLSRPERVEVDSWIVSEEDEADVLLAVADLPHEEKSDKQSHTQFRSVKTAASVKVVAEKEKSEPKEKAPRRWGFGMGAGSFTAGTNNAMGISTLRNETFDDEEWDRLNAASNSAFSPDAPRTDVKYRTPVSFGLGVSYYLSDRWALQSGLNYSWLYSKWSTNGTYRGETKQHMHFLGIPLSLSYKIAEWNRFRFYASAGAMAEVNVAGKVNTTLFLGTENMGSASSRQRMKEWYWSVNARTGVSYPLCRFVSAFAEVGASYYFDNGTTIETIHSEKPFNVDLQLGFRLGF